jgi:hypothetical protein
MAWESGVHPACALCEVHALTEYYHPQEVLVQLAEGSTAPNLRQRLLMYVSETGEGSGGKEPDAISPPPLSLHMPGSGRELEYLNADGEPLKRWRSGRDAQSISSFFSPE